MKISRYFNLEEFLISQTAQRKGIDMTPPDLVVRNLTMLALNQLDPIRSLLKVPIRISSGYRPPKLNKLIGGSATSQHCYGQAADFNAEGIHPYDVCSAIIKARIKFDQLIYEGTWVHISTAPASELRNQVLTAKFRAGKKTQYLAGLVR